MAKLTINTKKRRFPVAPHLYGLFFEDINRAADSGLYPEMLRNRAFDDSLIPSDIREEEGRLYSPTGWPMEFNGGEGPDRWIREHGIEPTDVPAWYAEGAEMELISEGTLNSKRAHALKVKFTPGGAISNIGYVGVPTKKGEKYDFYMFARAEKDTCVKVSMAAGGKDMCSAEIKIAAGDIARYDATLFPDATTGDGRFVIACPEGGEVVFGFTSLMPADTFKGHGLRKDLAEKLAAMKPGFLRFPGGCVVEGMSVSTAMRFSDTIGPVWERPGKINVWGYRTTDGLGFHEYLQLCEDLGAAPLYVVNCGMTCQGRNGAPMYGEDLDNMLNEAFDALEYAMGGADTKWGALRVKMGHPEPFEIRYFEIGNENIGPDYLERYEIFRKALLEKYPDLIIIANVHVEQDGYELDIADEHFYNPSDWFANHADIYDEYDRNGPEIFVGEFAVTSGPMRTLYPAIGEAMFMIGLEHNQDIVKLAAYAPLFENVHYRAWNPNLISFDNLRSSVIPSYYPWKMFAGRRGQNVLETEFDAPHMHSPVMRGGAAVIGTAGVKYRNYTWNGEKVEPMREIIGYAVKEDEGFTTIPADFGQMPPYLYSQVGGNVTLITMGEDEEAHTGVFETEAFVKEGQCVGVGMFCGRVAPQGHTSNDPATFPWNCRSVTPVRWVIENGMSTFEEGLGLRATKVAESVPTKINFGQYNKLKMVSDVEKLFCYVNDELVAEIDVPHYPAVRAVALDDGDEIIVKMVNIGKSALDVEMDFDCDVESEYHAQVLTGDPGVMNTLDEPDNVHDVCYDLIGAAKNFVYNVPACSATVLVFKKA